MAVLQAIFHKQNDTLFAGILALEVFPLVIDSVRKRATGTIGLAARHPFLWARQAVSRTITDITAVIESDGQK